MPSAFRTYKHTIVERVTPMLKTYALKLTIPMMEGLDAMAIVEWDATGTCFRELDYYNLRYEDDV